MIRDISKFIFVIICASLAFACATTTGTRESTTAQGGAVIQSIDINEGDVTIRFSNDAFRGYTLYKPGDPFRIIVQLPGVDPGSYRSKIFTTGGPVAEINPVLVTEPVKATELEILLQSPAELVPVVNGNALVLKIEGIPSLGESDLPQGTESVAEADFAALSTEETAENDAEEGEPVGRAFWEEMMGKEAEAPAAQAPAAEAPAAQAPAAEAPAAQAPAAEAPAAQASMQKASGAASRITGIKFGRTATAVEVIIETDGAAKPNVFPLDNRIVLDFAGVKMAAKMPQEIAYPLKGIRVGKHSDKTRIVLDLSDEASYDVIALNGAVVVSLSTPDMGAPEGEMTKVVKKAAPGTLPVAGAAAAIEQEEKDVQEIQAEAEGRYVGKRISLDFQDADIVPIFRLFSDVSGYNIVVSPEVKGKITMKLINVPWDQALDLVLRTHNLGKQIQGNIIRIAPNKDLAQESEEKARAKEAILKALPLSTRVFTINYAGVDRIRDAIDKAKLISPRGSMTIDERASVIVINDVDETFPKVQSLISQLDRPELQVRQVLIEARIVEATTAFVRELGIQWGATGQSDNGRFAVGGTTPPGGAGGTGFSGNNFLVNLPAAVGPGSGGGIALGYLNASRTLALDLQISALERTGVGKIVSNPRIVTMNNTPAKIIQGRTIYVPVATSDKTDIKPVDALLELDVIPSIAPDGGVLMKIKITKDEPGDVVAGNISINRNAAETSTLISSGDTVVIGGIYKDTLLKSEDGLPFLSKIPVLGWLFKKERKSEDIAEIIMFITPRIVNYEAKKETK